MRKIVIAIDGYSACGKSSTAKEVASQLGYSYIDSGAMYRAVTLYFHENYVTVDNPKDVSNALDKINISFVFNERKASSETYLNGLNVEEEIRKMYISNQVSKISAISEVRKSMVSQQRKLGKKKGVVMDGRDIGSNVFPDAELKVFMNAGLEIRAERRQKELLEKDQLVPIPEIEENLLARDKMDSERKENPLVIPDDAYILDTSELTLPEQVEYVLQLATEKMIKHDS
ncbi:cytidylate kinase [Marivirga tractuosa]|uniref:Cytidylate kinase n=1 Tax=Marivirga tractuosa (strain ATCC 23168 / DSM 4126 / NBRC 15989 / NCIMB 1408 / VKM B-1430 / H-43) TaxID=643867 RepID=E4TPF8_MARTH|nr:(d)CMP kinase [Marivirga tractuosa]ADR21546.1 cytidylate kinase [Marivirga tractuosa DSM 4126]BDD14000.1 cytidylate kinase [Marivirga tractuosa]